MSMTYLINKIHRSQKGISLIEILLSLAILGFIGYYFSGMINLVDQGNKTDQSLTRMNEIAEQLKDFYRGQQNLPAPNDNERIDDIIITTNELENLGEVPVQQLNLSQKYRLDTWGQYILYFYLEKQRDSEELMVDIVGCKADGRITGGVLISLGPDQQLNSEYNLQNNPAIFTAQGDDLIIPITLEKEAWEISMGCLEVLNKRVDAYDRHFAGVDNRDLSSISLDSLNSSYIHQPPGDPPYPYPPYPNPTVSDPGAPGYHPDSLNFLSSGNYYLLDADGCVPAIVDSGTICIPDPPVDFLINDPNCGRASIDACSNPADALTRILTIYGLGNKYSIDPWGNSYQWGNSSIFENEDRRYHLFYSMGPDGEPNTDDDITPY